VHPTETTGSGCRRTTIQLLWCFPNLHNLCDCVVLQEVKEKKRWGRLQKSKGDWSLLVGSPKDAFEHYKSAMDLSRAAGDAIW
jgi:hypothetical protein